MRLKDNAQKSTTPSLATIELINNQFVLTGANLSNVTVVKIKEGATETALDIESVTPTKIITNTLSNVAFAAGRVFNFILSDANGASTFTVNFSLCDSSLNGKGFNCSITAQDKDVLSFDATTNKWIPRNVNGLAYKGVFDASLGVDPAGSPSAGDYYIITVAGTINSVSYAVGDWISYSGDEWQKIANSRTVLSVYGRTGNVTAREGDYNLDKLADVDLTTTPPVNNNILKYNSGTSKWVPANLTETDPNVSSFAKAALPTCGASEVLKGDGTSLSCVTVSGGGGVTSITGTSPVSVGGTASVPVISMAAATTSANGYLTSTDWNTFNGKQSALGFTPINKAGDTVASGTFTFNGAAVLRTLDPVGATDVATKQYVDAQAGAWTVGSGNAYRTSGNVGIGTSSPGAKLDVRGLISADQLSMYNYTGGGTHNMIELSTENGAAGAAERGIYTNLDWGGGANASSSIHGALFSVDIYPGSGTLGKAAGAESQILLTDGATTSAYGFISSVTLSGTATLANAYGLYVGNIQGTAPWSIYASDATAPSYFAGRVGIGTTSPGYKLQVGAAGDGTEARANAWNTLSDERLKRDFEIIPDSLEKILSLNGYYYYWNRGSDTSKKMGVKAQEVEKVFPEVVSHGEDGFLSVSYNHLVAGMIEAVKEFHQKWLGDSEAIHRELASKDEEIAKLKSENTAIKTYLCSKDQSAEFCK